MQLREKIVICKMRKNYFTTTKTYFIMPSINSYMPKKYFQAIAGVYGVCVNVSPSQNT